MDLSLINELSPSVWFLVKIIIIFGLSIYAIFSFVVVKQVNLMTETLQLGLESTIKVFAFLHFLVALTLIFISVFLL